jgi:mycofactocin precursor
VPDFGALTGTIRRMDEHQDATADSDALADQELVEDELLVEEISIDGMCGVY